MKRRGSFLFNFFPQSVLENGTCATLEIEVKLRSGFYSQIGQMTGATHLTEVPDLNVTPISTVRGVEIGDIRVSGSSA